MSHEPIVSVLGNSVPILIQPFRHSVSERTYSEHLRDRGFTVRNAAKQSAMITDVYRYLEDECIREFPDFVIVHFGIVEATYRARPRWLQNVFAMNAWNNSIINKGYNGPVTRGIKFISKKLYRKSIERTLYTLNLKRRWVSPARFQFALRDIIKRIFSDTPAKRVIIIGMPKVADWVEREAPGTNESITEYNAIMRHSSEEYANISFLDIEQLQVQTPATISPDGIHFTAAGHAQLADMIAPILTGERQDYTDWQQINQYAGLYKHYERWYKRPTSRLE